MSSVYLKISSLLIRTLSKPIANKIKQQARDHEGFRRICISFAQTMHRLDMRLRLGLLQDQAAIERQIAKDAAHHRAQTAAKEAAKRENAVPTVKTEAQTKAEEAAAAKEAAKESKEAKKVSQPKIRPLSEAKAIDSGANFISESFLFSVGLGLIILEGWRSRRKETNRRDLVTARIEELEARNKTLEEKEEKLEEAVKELRELKEARSAGKAGSWNLFAKGEKGGGGGQADAGGRSATSHTSTPAQAKVEERDDTLPASSGKPTSNRTTAAEETTSSAGGIQQTS